MTLEKWAHASEVFGSVAIVVSLVILIHEVRSNTLVQERQTQWDRMVNTTDVYLNSPELANVYAKVKAVDGIEPVAGAFVERYGLTPAEAVLWSRVVQRTLLMWQSQYQFSGGRDDLDHNIRNIFIRYPDVQIAFEINEDDSLSPEFVAYVDAIVDEP